MVHREEIYAFIATCVDTLDLLKTVLLGTSTVDDLLYLA